MPKVQRSWVEPVQLLALIKAADEFHRPILATLAGAGLPVGEAVALDRAEQLGHTDPAFTFRVYQKAAKRRERLSGE